MPIKLKKLFYNIPCTCCSDCIITNQKQKDFFLGAENKVEKTNMKSSCFITFTLCPWVKEDSYQKNIILNEYLDSPDLLCDKARDPGADSSELDDTVRSKVFDRTRIYSNWNVLNTFLKYEAEKGNLNSVLNKVNVQVFCNSLKFKRKDINKILNDFKNDLEKQILLLDADQYDWYYSTLVLKNKINFYGLEYKDTKKLNPLEIKAETIDVKYLGCLYNEQNL